MNIARLERLEQHLQIIRADAADAAAYLEYGGGLTEFDLALDINTEVRKVREHARAALELTQQLIAFARRWEEAGRGA